MKTIGIPIHTLDKEKKEGIDYYTYNIVRSILNVDKINKYILYTNNSFIFKNINNNNYEYKTIKNFPFWTQTKLLKEINNDIPDVFINFNLTTPFLIDNHIKFILFIYDLAFLHYPSYFKFFDRHFLKFNIKNSAKKANHILVNSNNTKNDIINKYNINKNRITNISSGFNLSKNYIGSQEFKEIKEKYNINNKEYILSIGTLQKRKNLHRLIQAYNIIRKKYNIKEKLVIIGKMGWKSKEFIEELNDSVYKNDIVITGYVSEKEKYLLLKNALLFAYPSLYEGFGIPLLEAMECGIPIITSNISSMPEISKDAAILVDPKDHMNMADNIYNLIINKSKRDKLINRGYKRVTYFSWRKSANSLYDVIQNI